MYTLLLKINGVSKIICVSYSRHSITKKAVQEVIDKISITPLTDNNITTTFEKNQLILNINGFIYKWVINNVPVI